MIIRKIIKSLFLSKQKRNNNFELEFILVLQLVRPPKAEMRLLENLTSDRRCGHIVATLTYFL